MTSGSFLPISSKSDVLFSEELFETRPSAWERGKESDNQVGQGDVDHAGNQQDANDLMMIMIIIILQLLTCLMATPASRQIISRLHSSKASTGNYHDIGTAIDDSDDDV